MSNSRIGSAVNLYETLLLDSLADVTITSPSDNDLLAYDTASGLWINQTPAQAGLDDRYVNVTGDTMTGDLNLGANSLIAHIARADASDGLLIEANNGTDVAILGAGNTANALFYGGVNIVGALDVNGTVTLDNSNGFTMGNMTTAAGTITMYANTSGQTATLTAGLTYAAAGENGLITERLRLSQGRFDFDASGGKAELRLDASNTLFNIFNKGSFTTLATFSEAGLLVGGDGNTAATQKLTVIGNYELRDSLGSPVKRIRFRTSGGDIDVEGAGKDIYWSVWSAQDYTGTQRYYMRWEAGAQLLTFVGSTRFGDSPFGGRHYISGTGGVVFNENGDDADTRIEGDTITDLLFVDASEDSVKLGGGVKHVVAIKSADYTLTTKDHTVVFTATATATLPAATGSGRTYRIICRAGTLTIDANGTDTIKGSLTQTLTAGEDLILSDTAAGIYE